MFWRSVGILTLALAILGVGGCAAKKINVTGTVVREGKPLPFGKTGYVEIILIPDVSADKGFTTRPGRADAEGKFEIPEVLPGKYRIAVYLRDPMPMDDKLNGEFSNEKTKIVRTIDGKTPLSIDLAKTE